MPLTHFVARAQFPAGRPACCRNKRTRSPSVDNAIELAAFSRICRAARVDEYVDLHGLALIKLGLGDRAGAIEMLERAEQERFPWLVRLRVEPRWAPLHDERRFQELIRRVGIPGV